MRVLVLSNNRGRCAAVVEALVFCPEEKHDVSIDMDGDLLGSLHDFDLVIVAGWPKKIPSDLLKIPKYGFWNCHAGPVPEYRGGSPLNWQIIDGKALIGVTVMKMDGGLDTGPVLAESWFPLPNEQTIEDAHFKANAEFNKMIRELIDDPGAAGMPQTGDGYRKQRTDDDGEIDLSWPKDRIVNFVRALTHPYPGAWIDVNGERLRIWSAS